MVAADYSKAVGSARSVHTDATPIDLVGPDMDEIDRRLRMSVSHRDGPECLEGV